MKYSAFSSNLVKPQLLLLNCESSPYLPRAREHRAFSIYAPGAPRMSRASKTGFRTRALFVTSGCRVQGRGTSRSWQLGGRQRAGSGEGTTLCAFALTLQQVCPAVHWLP